MTDRTVREISEASGAEDKTVTTLLSRAYAAPADTAYWEGLEKRVMMRIRESDQWWSVFSEWRTAGLAAAAVALLVAGATLVREYQLDASERQLAASAAVFTVFDDSAEGVAVALSGPISTRPDSPDRILGLIKP